MKGGEADQPSRELSDAVTAERLRAIGREAQEDGAPQQLRRGAAARGGTAGCVECPVKRSERRVRPLLDVGSLRPAPLRRVDGGRGGASRTRARSKRRKARHVVHIGRKGEWQWTGRRAPRARRAGSGGSPRRGPDRAGGRRGCRLRLRHDPSWVGRGRRRREGGLQLGAGRGLGRGRFLRLGTGRGLGSGRCLRLGTGRGLGSGRCLRLGAGHGLGRGRFLRLGAGHGLGRGRFLLLRAGHGLGRGRFLLLRAGHGLGRGRFLLLRAGHGLGRGRFLLLRAGRESDRTRGGRSPRRRVADRGRGTDRRGLGSQCTREREAEENCEERASRNAPPEVNVGTAHCCAESQQGLTLLVSRVEEDQSERQLYSHTCARPQCS